MPPRVAFRDFDEKAFGGNGNGDSTPKDEFDRAKSTSLIEYRKFTKEYIDKKFEEIKKKHRSNTELVERLSELMKL